MPNTPPTRNRPGVETSEHRITMIFGSIIVLACVAGIVTAAILKAPNLALVITGLAAAMSFGLSMLGRGYSESRGLAKSEPPGDGDGGFIRSRALLALSVVTALVMALLASGCGMTHLERLEYAGKTSNNAWKNGHPALTKLAQSEATKCRAAAPSSQPVELKDCPGAGKWLKALKALRAACDTVDAAVIIGAPLALVDDKLAAGWAAAAITALKREIEILQQAGLLPAGS